MDRTHDWTATWSRMEVGERNGDRMMGSMCRWHGSPAGTLPVSTASRQCISEILDLIPAKAAWEFFKARFIYLFVCV